MFNFVFDTKIMKCSFRVFRQIRGGCIQDGAKCGAGNDNCCNAKSTCHAVPYGFKDGNFLYGMRCASPKNQEGLNVEKYRLQIR